MFEGFSAVMMFVMLFGLVFLGIPVAISLISTAFVFGLMVFGDSLSAQMHSRIDDVGKNFVLAAIPLFIFMGAMLERSGIANRLFDAVRMWLGRLPGGLSLTTIVMCAIFAATSGVVGAVEIVVGLMAIPAMLAAGYAKDLAAGCVCAGGSLGTTIPPSVVIIIYASITEQSVGDLFAGIMIPAVAMVAMFIIYILGRCILQPSAGPGLPPSESTASLAEKLWFALTAFVPAAVLVTAVLGSIFAGIASPTEAAAVGSFGAVVLTAAYGRLTPRVLYEALKRTIMINSMVMLIVVGGVMFASVFIVSGGDELIGQLVEVLELSPLGIVILFLAIVFILGFVLDWISVLLIALPIFDPLVRAAGIDPVWFGVLVCIALQTSYLTPPMAPSIFYLRAIAPPEITYMDMYKGVAPFVMAQLVILLLVMVFPWMATFLPEYLFGW
jgi:tripartite ATP-independent transporter DctM subunit